MLFRYTKAIVCLLLLSLYACTSLEQTIIKIQEIQEITVTPSPLEYHQDSISFQVAVAYPQSVSISNETEHLLQLVYHPEQGDVSTIAVIDLGSILSIKEREITQSVKIPYKIEWQYGEVLAQTILINLQDTVKSNLIKVADGIITTSLLTDPPYYLHQIPHGYVTKTEYEPKKFTFFFPSNKSNTGSISGDSTDLKLLEEVIAQNNIKGNFSIIASHSPEKNEASSESLSEKRISTSQSFIKKLYTKYGHTFSADWERKVIYRDWSLFSRELKVDTLLSKDEKEQILNVIDGGGDYLNKEVAFKKLKCYSKMEELYQRLRKVEISINVQKKQFSQAELVLQSNKIISGELPASHLKVEELAFIASQTPSIEQKIKIYEQAIKAYPSVTSATLKNNLAVIYLQKSETETNENAKLKLIEKAIIELNQSLKTDKQNPKVLLNLAAAQVLKADENAAINTILEISEQADTLLNPSINALKGYIYLKRANYITAIKQFSMAGNSPKVLYNKAFAYLLYASQNNLKSTLPSAERAFLSALDADKEYALAYYCAAITAARLNDEKTMGKYLKEATSRSETLRKRASKDLEFAQFRNSEVYKDAISAK